MFRCSIVFLCVVSVLSYVEYNNVQARKYSVDGSRSRYLKSGGLSGLFHSYPCSFGEKHGYPASGGLSGNGGRGVGYPSEGDQIYPNSGRSHSYPTSAGSSGGLGYPKSGGSSGSHSYPESEGRSGTNNHGSAGRGNKGRTTNVHQHYHYNYNPPQQIHYASPYGGPAKSFPVYRGNPPTYVYQYKESGSRYGTLLAGLALFNLGALAGGAVGYGVGHSRYNDVNDYLQKPNEVCLFGVKKDNGDFEETRIDCRLISSFIYAEEAKQQNPQNPTNDIVVTTMTHTTVVNKTNVQDTPVYVLSPNGTLVPPASALPNAGNATIGAPVTGGTVTSSVIITSTNTTTVSAVDVKGPAIQVTPGMKCYVMSRTPIYRMKRELPCILLQTYADTSLVPALTIVDLIFAVLVNN